MPKAQNATRSGSQFSTQSIPTFSGFHLGQTKTFSLNGFPVLISILTLRHSSRYGTIYLLYLIDVHKKHLVNYEFDIFYLVAVGLEKCY